MSSTVNLTYEPAPSGGGVQNNVGSSERSPSELHGLLPELNGVELAMSLSPKHHQHQVLSHLQQLHHSTPFSVTDILSPIEESYRKLELGGNPPSPYRWVQLLLLFLSF